MNGIRGSLLLGSAWEGSILDWLAYERYSALHNLLIPRIRIQSITRTFFRQARSLFSVSSREVLASCRVRMLLLAVREPRGRGVHGRVLVTTVVAELS